MIIWVLFNVFHLLAISQCSLILDMPGQPSTLKYCGQIGECKPGEHVMCMFYRPGLTMAPNCIGEPIELSPQNRNQIMSKINKIRSEITSGVTTGKDNVLLPRAFGLKDLEWDDELARFAQIWANQCNFESGDQCRATERFPNPGQFMGGIRFSIPTAGKSSINDVLKISKTIAQSKASSIIESITNLVYNTKNYVTKDMVYKHVGSGRRSLFLLAVYGWTTHIGCAMAYWVSHDADKKSNLPNLCSAAIVCNLSAKPVEGKKVYETENVSYRRADDATETSSPPTTTESTTTTSISTTTVTHNDCTHDQVKQSVVVMPIVKIEEGILTDELPKLDEDYSTNQRRSNFILDTTKAPTRFSVIANNMKITDDTKMQQIVSTTVTPLEKPRSDINKQMLDIKYRYFYNKSIVPGREKDVTGTLKPDNGNFSPYKIPHFNNHGSIFTRVSRFQLPSQQHDKKDETHNLPWKKKNSNSHRLSKHDVARLENLVSEYFIKKQSRHDSSPLNIINPLINTVMQFLKTYPLDTDVDIINTNNQILQKQPDLHRNFKFSNEEIDEELLHFMCELVEASGVDLNEIVETTTRIIQDDSKKHMQMGRNVSPFNFDDREGIRLELDHQLKLRRQNPLSQYDKQKTEEYDYNMTNDNDKNIHGTGIGPFLILDNYTRHLEGNKMNDNLVFEKMSKRKKYFYENKERPERKRRNRHNYRRHNSINVDNVYRPMDEIRHVISVSKGMPPFGDHVMFVADKARPQFEF